MPSYTTSLRLVQPATGEYSGTWGTQVNTGITALVDASIAGTTSITMTAANYTLTTANGASDESRAMFLVLGGTPGAAREVIVPAVSKLYFVTNSTTGGFAQTVKTASGSGISVPNGARMTLRCDGTDVVVAQNYFASMTLGAALPTASGGTGLTSFTANGVVYASSTSALATGSGLVFDGTNFGIGTSSPGAKLEVASGKVLLSNTQSYAIKTNAGGSCDVVTLTSGNVLQLGGGGATDSVQFWNQGLERMRLDSSGNLGLGVTPSAWGGGFRALQIYGRSSIASDNGNRLWLNSDCYNNGTNWIYGASGVQVSQYQAWNGQHAWFTAASGTAGNAISFTQSMTLDASGRLGIGTTSPSYPLDIAKSFSVYSAYINNTSTNTSDYNVLLLTGASSGMPAMMLGSGGTAVANAGVQGAGYVGTQNNTPLVFVTNDSARARITAGGEVYIAGTADQGAYNLQVSGTGVWGAGAYVNGSDERLKDNIQTLDDGLSVVCQLRPVTFQYKPEYSKDQSVQPGFIAQELQQAMEGKDYLEGVVQSGPEYLNVAYQNLIPILTRAIQEQQALITDLRARVAALEQA